MQDTAKKLLKLYRDGKADMYKANDMALNDEVKSIVDAALAAINSANALTIESGAEAVDAAAKQILQQRYALDGAQVLDQYLDQLNQADAHLTELQNELSREGPGMPEGNAELSAALEAIQNAAALNDASLTEIKEHLKKLREAYAVLDGAGVLEKYQEMFDAASQHLGDLMQQIAKG